MENLEIMAIGRFCWGRGETIKEAAEKAIEHGGLGLGESNELKFFVVPPGTSLTDMGLFHVQGEHVPEDGSNPCRFIGGLNISHFLQEDE